MNRSLYVDTTIIITIATCIYSISKLVNKIKCMDTGHKKEIDILKIRYTKLLYEMDYLRQEIQDLNSTNAKSINVLSSKLSSLELEIDEQEIKQTEKTSIKCCNNCSLTLSPIMNPNYEFENVITSDIISDITEESELNSVESSDNKSPSMYKLFKHKIFG
jgi:hypothetical protein